MYEIARNSKKIRTYSSSMSSKVIELSVNPKPIFDFRLVINLVTLDVSPTVFEILAFKARKWPVFPTRTCLTSHSAWTPCDINVTYTSLKSAFNGLQFCRWQYGSICICLTVLPPKHEKCREIQREFNLTAVQGHPRQSIFVSMESPYVTSY